MIIIINKVMERVRILIILHFSMKKMNNKNRTLLQIKIPPK
jgi:hypothetical protein